MVTTSTWKFEVIPSDLQVRPALHVALVSVNESQQQKYMLEDINKRRKIIQFSYKN